MRKLSYVLCFLIFIFSGIATSQAEENIQYDWLIKSPSNHNYIMLNNNRVVTTGTTIDMYDENKKLLKSLPNSCIYSVDVNDKIICFENNDQATYKVTLFNNELEEITSSIINSFRFYWNPEVYEIDGYYVMETSEKLLVLSSDLKEVTDENIIADLDEKLWQEEKEILKSLGIEEIGSNVLIGQNDGYTLVANLKEDAEVLNLYNPEKQLTLTLDLQKFQILDFQDLTQIILYNQGIYITYLLEDTVYIAKYDYNGNEVYTFNLTEALKQENIWLNHLMVYDSKINERELVLSLRAQAPRSIDEVNSLVVKLSFIYNIYTQTDGLGTIEADTSSKAGEDKVFQVIPKEGYEVDQIIITDSYGNTIVYSNTNAFTMPNADVTIKATFKKIEDQPLGEGEVENPETGATIPIIAILGGIVLLGGIYIYIKKNKKFTKLK